MGLTFYDAGARSFYGHQPIDRPDDLKGLRIRVQPSPTMVRMMRLFGAEPMPMQWDVVYTALRSRLIDGAENSLAALVFGPHGEVVRYYSFTEHTMVPDVFLVGAQTWSRLTPPQRDLFREAARQSFDTMEALWAKTEGDWRRAGEGMGVIFNRPDKRPFMDRVAPLKADAAQPIADLVRRVESV